MNQHNNNNTEVQPTEDAYTRILKFLEESRIVFDLAICATPTSEERSRLTDLNIKRMQFIAEGNAAALHSIRLHNILDKLVIETEEREEMSADDSRLGDATAVHDVLFKQLMEIMNE